MTKITSVLERMLNNIEELVIAQAVATFRGEDIPEHYILHRFSPDDLRIINMFVKSYARIENMDTPSVPVSVLEEWQHLALKGERINAINALRAWSGDRMSRDNILVPSMGLKEAKDRVESFIDRARDAGYLC